MKNKFFGIYYKHVSLNGDMIAVIDSISNEGPMVQVITNDFAITLYDISQVKVSMTGISLDIHQDSVTIVGDIKYGELLKNKKDVMSYYRFLPIECKHKIYSMYHELNGSLTINGKVISFDHGYGYIEGDRGRNFPKEYLWLNASKPDTSITLAIATIPLGLFKILGTTCIIAHNGKEYRFGTYNFAKPTLISRNHVIVKKGKYILDINIDDFEGKALKAPEKGDMVRYIHECPSVNIHYTLKKKDEVIVDTTHPYASFEYMFSGK